ncbi:cation diffusion facilitator 1 [Drepanopeziza brunnea f. sp. 'multigermtubi' MB_m1]|uniref:Cation diffusion facilitator 1 n=1 Tax=Marssonina brunnea f. sp. multigermtubi (strain MB_m1) TaxID=1072389 RepID=K1X0J9_MARBU|nr:cation diffusion facilitator 1 [Drepanopeziza brunnea f. sp. 'multigermtubi' MB_m1]EKD18671.1 cation diffusion facilitator 1 [Drepanopeziza brunnea f. sp. 'multigermtubi' MB_m1]
MPNATTELIAAHELKGNKPSPETHPRTRDELEPSLSTSEIESARSLAGGPRNDDTLKLMPLLFVGIAIWFLDTAGAICIAILILASSVSTAYEHMWFLVDKTAPQEFLNKLVYMSITHDTRVKKIDTLSTYHAGDKYYIEVDIIMDENEQLQVTHDVSQTLQRKLEGLADVERAFAHVDYDGDHSVLDEYRPLYEHEEKKSTSLGPRQGESLQGEEPRGSS